ncbi:flippase-like domain-containing protein [Candidatus Woesearchaeota archaeon]|nr:flippase-like domain-containing protein [Candidatus Woesearchaeota archaeon]MCF7900831.1 flippase-like domain-containing protein [Candidatus Woesearchaeota archaeon]MCF8014070.1 flippase-like domain-containing protein [Candidatus Woesearchaeota archaeon]
MARVLRKNLTVIVSILIGLAALGYILSNITIDQVFDTFKDATIELILIFILIQFVMFLVLTYRWKLILHSQNHKDIGVWRLMGYKLVGYAVSFITPSAKIGGEPVRAGLLSSKENMSFQRALSSVVIDKTIELSTNGFFTVLGFILILFSFVISENIKTMLIVIIVIFLCLIFLFNYNMIKGKKFLSKFFLFFSSKKKKSKLLNKVIEFEDLVVKFYSADTKHFFYSLFWSVVSWLLMFFEFKVAAMIVGLNISVFQIFLIVCVVGAAFVVPIPMGLGALEAGQVGLFALFAISQAAGVALAFVIRIKDIFLTIIGFILLAFYGLNLKEVIKDTSYITKDVKKLKKEEIEK